MSLNDIILRSAWFIFSPLVRGLLIVSRLVWLLPRPSLEPLKALAPAYLTGYGSLAVFKRCPPEILEEIFAHTCGAEYIGFFKHFSLRQADDSKTSSYSFSQINTVYLLKSVCKEWKELAERSPRLWQRVYFDFDDFWIEKALFRSVQHFESMVKHVLLQRSAGLGLHIKISGQTYEREQLDMRSRMRFFVPLLHILTQDGHRWSSAVFWDLDTRWSGGNSAVYPILQSLMAHTSFPRLHSFIYDMRASGHPDDVSPKLDLSSSAPALKELIIRAGNFEGLRTLHPMFKCRWSSLTTLVIDCQGIAHRSPTLLHVSPVFEAVRNNLVTLHWRGSLNIPPGAAPHPSVELRALRTLVVEDTAFAICDILLASISCPMLQTLQILLCKGYISPPDHQWAQCIPHGISKLEEFLFSAPLLQTFTIISTPELEIYLLHQEKDTKKSKRLEHGYLLLHGSPSEVRTKVQPLAENVQDRGLSTLPIIRLNLMESHLVDKAFTFVPVNAYSLRPSKGRGAEPARLLPPCPVTLWERGLWSERPYGEKDRVERLLAFVQSLDKGLTSSIDRNPDPERMMQALRKLDHLSTLVWLHVLELLAAQDILPSSCKVTFSIAT